MAKEPFISGSITIDDELGAGVDISNDVLSLSFNTPLGSFDVSGQDKLAFEKISLLQGFDITLNMAFNAAVQHTVFASVWSNAVERTFVLVVSGQILTVEVLFSNYEIQRGSDGALTCTVSGEVSNAVAPVWST